MSQAVRRFALLTEYDGSDFLGWQIQAAGRTVQSELQQALVRLGGGAPIQLHGCSRTDAGVHARGHVSHFDSAMTIPVERLPLALNSCLPPDLVVRAACQVDSGFHARFSSLGKRYSYTCWNHAIRPALSRKTICHVPGDLDLTAMERAIPHFLGEQDFSALMDQNGCEVTPVRRIDKIDLQKTGPCIRIYVEGSGFLYHMVRIIAGTLLAAGQGKIQPADLPRLLAAGDRRQMGKTMPACGLCLEQVFYQPPLFADTADWLEGE